MTFRHLMYTLATGALLLSGAPFGPATALADACCVEHDCLMTQVEAECTERFGGQWWSGETCAEAGGTRSCMPPSSTGLACCHAGGCTMVANLSTCITDYNGNGFEGVVCMEDGGDFACHGACCTENSCVTADDAGAQCAHDYEGRINWYPTQTCQADGGDFVCPHEVGACCHPGGCTDYPQIGEYLCNVDSGDFVQDETCSSIECDESSSLREERHDLFSEMTDVTFGTTQRLPLKIPRFDPRGGTRTLVQYKVEYNLLFTWSSTVADNNTAHLVSGLADWDKSWYATLGSDNTRFFPRHEVLADDHFYFGYERDPQTWGETVQSGEYPGDGVGIGTAEWVSDPERLRTLTGTGTLEFTSVFSLSDIIYYWSGFLLGEWDPNLFEVTPDHLWLTMRLTYQYRDGGEGGSCEVAMPSGGTRMSVVLLLAATLLFSLYIIRRVSRRRC